MPPKRVVVQSSSARQQNDGLLGSAYREIKSSENTTIVRSVVVFGVCNPLIFGKRFMCSVETNVLLGQIAVAFLHSSLSEFLLPP